MKHKIKIENANQVYSSWCDKLSFSKLIPTPSVISILEVSEEIKLAALSPHHDYLAVISRTGVEGDVLAIIYLKEKRVKVLRSFQNLVQVISFISTAENVLLVGSSCGRIFKFDIEDKTSHTLEGHTKPPLRISHQSKSDLLLTWNFVEVLLWSWPNFDLKKRLKIDSNNSVIEAGHIWEKLYIFAGFDSGVILIWNQNEGMKETAIEPPDGITMKFKSFALSLNGDWILGIGSQSFVVIYSMTSLQMVQAVHLPCPEARLGVERVQFLPCIHPQFSKVYLLQTSDSIIIIDFVNSSTIKVLRTPTTSIDGISISDDGSLLAVVYANGIAKLYTLLSFFPKPKSTLRSKEGKVPIDFNILKSESGRRERKKKAAAKLFDSSKWKDILEEFEEFPNKYRLYIWINLLKLPQNFSILNEILAKEKKHKFDSLKNEFKQMTDGTFEILKSTLECLCYWSPFLAELEFLPHFVFPFAEFFECNVLLCFEVAVTIILNWCRFWFQDWPKPPEIILKMADQIICELDPPLWIHLQEIGISPENSIWLMLTTNFRQVFTKEDWLVIWDHILSQTPPFAVCVCAAFILCLRQALLKCSHKSHAQELFCQETWIPVRTIIRKAKQLFSSLKSEELKEEMKTLRFLPQNDMLPFDIGPGNFFSWRRTLDDTMYALADLKSLYGPRTKARLCQMSSPTLRNDYRERKARIEGVKTLATMDSEEFVNLEEACFKNVQHMREKIISRVE